jgi:hypothetical protein
MRSVALERIRLVRVDARGMVEDRRAAEAPCMSWPWTTPQEHIEPSDGARPMPPWSAWARHFARQFGVAESERLAVAIGMLLEFGPHEPTRLRLALARLGELGLARSDVAVVLLEASLLEPPAPLRANDDDRESSITPDKLALLCGLCALAAARDPLPWIRFAAATAELLAMFEGLLDLVDDAERDDSAPPRIGALLRACRDRGGPLDSLLDACAGTHAQLERSRALRCAVTDPAVLQQLGASRASLVADARSALPEVGPEPGEAFLAALLDGFSALEGALWMRGVMARATPTSTPADWSTRASVDAALDWLEQTRPWASAWDVHRFHPMGADRVLVARTFIETLIVLALAEVGREDPAAEIAALFERIPEGDFRYFPDWSGLPPDCDSLGLLLQLATWLPRGLPGGLPRGLPSSQRGLPSSQRGRVEGWIAVLEASLGSDSSVPTWLVHGPNGRMTPRDGPFLGDDCTGATLAFLLGALRYDGDRFAPLFRRNLQLILARGCEAGSLHYTREFALHLLLRLFHALRSHPSPQFPALVDELGLERLAVERSDALLASQRIDGGWGTPQTTALALEGLIHWCPDSPGIARAITYLVHTQGPDGAWPAEPLYITPGKFGKMVPFSAKPLTTALCVRALHIAAKLVD